MTRILRLFSYVILLGTCIAFQSCDDDDPQNNGGSGTITGIVTDDKGHPLADVKVTVSGIKEEDVSVTTGADGRYTVANVSLKLHAVTFSKTEWLTISKSVAAKDFDADNLATLNAAMVSATAKIVGIIIDARNNNSPLADVTVTIGVAGTSKSTGDGKFALENLIVDDYTITFTKTNYVTVTKAVNPTDFVDGVATVSVTMGGQELLRDLTASDLARADKWYYNEYRGGRNGDAYPHWDWSCDYMSTLDFRGAWQEQNEGTTLQIRNSDADRKNPGDLNVFDSFVYGSKLITAENRIMSIRLRTHNADASAPAYYGVQVVDLSVAEPAAVKIGETKTYGSGDYGDIEFDLSNYVGKEVIIAIGIYRQATGDYWKQLVLRAIRFADRKVVSTDWLPGTEVVNGWELTQETVHSTMPHTKKVFTGLTKGPILTPKEEPANYSKHYRAWRETAHVGAEWSFVPLKKDPEVFADEGYILKTRDTPETSTTVPESYMYAKFAIGAGSNKLTFRTRNFGGNYTYFKITAIEDNGTVTHLDPQTFNAQEASAATDGCWKFRHGSGDTNHDGDYASFVYDLSQFNGRNVTIVIGVYNGAGSTGENKLVFRAIQLN